MREMQRTDIETYWFRPIIKLSTDIMARVSALQGTADKEINIYYVRTTFIVTNSSNSECTSASLALFFC